MDIIAYTDRKKCSCCGACVNVCPHGAIEYERDDYGFTYPKIDEERCVSCGLCVSACNSVQTAIKVLPIKAYAAVNKNGETLRASSSGGVFSALAEYVLASGGAVCGCVFDESLTPVHICTEKKEDYLRMRRSKYVQSDVGHVYRDIKKRLKDGQLVLFTGTPCQVAALKATVGEKRERLLTVDLVCHGVPNDLMFKKFIKYLEAKYKTEIVDFNFRSKKYGWARYTMEFTSKGGRVKNIGKTDEFYYPAFSEGVISRESCFACRFACKERVGDFTIGDLWGYEKIALACGKANGISICTLNNEKAIALLPVLSERLTMEEIDYRDAISGNTCLHDPTAQSPKWQTYMDALKADEVARLAQGYIKKNRMRILRGRLKLALPLSVFRFVRVMRAKK